MSLESIRNWFARPAVQKVLAKIQCVIQAIRKLGGAPLPTLALALSLAQSGSAAIASLGSLATANNKASGSSWTFTISAQLDAGNAGVLVIAVDNQDTGDSNSSLCTSVSDAAGNDWVKAREFTNGQSSVDAGVTVCIYYTKAAATLASSGNVTVNFSASKTAKGATMWEFSMGATKILTVAGGVDLANDATDAGSMTIAGLSSNEYLFVRGGAVENNGTSYTASTNYTGFTHTSSTTSGGGAASNMGARGEFRIVTATGDSTNPTTASADQASTYIALSEIDPSTGGGPRRIFISRRRASELQHE